MSGTPLVVQRALVSRRGFLKAGVAASGTLALGPTFWRRAYAQQSQLTIGDGPYGSLQPPDANGLMLPEGFTSRVVARSNLPVGLSGYLWHIWPDGGHCFPTDDGGWVYCCNSENPVPSDQPGLNDPHIGGASSIRFDPEGNIVDAFRVLGDTRSNCAGGPTPWGTWLSCEEFQIEPGDAGRVWEVDPLVPYADQEVKVHDAMGSYKHEMVAIDPERRHLYLTEDQGHDEDEGDIGGLLYRYTPSAWPDLSAGLLEAAVVAADGRVSWIEIPDPGGDPVETREQVDAAHFDGGEGCWYDSGHVYITTKGDNRVWDLDIAAERLGILYDDDDFDEPVLQGVDNIIVSSFTGDILVAEDGGNMEVVLITPDGVVAPLARATGPEHGRDNPAPGTDVGPIPVGDIPTESEITGLAFNPDGSRLYFNSQRGAVWGITYEVTGPFVEGREAVAPPASPPTSPPAPDGGGTGGPSLPTTGGGLALAAGVVAAAAALRRRGRRTDG